MLKFASGIRNKMMGHWESLSGETLGDYQEGLNLLTDMMGMLFSPYHGMQIAVVDMLPGLVDSVRCDGTGTRSRGSSRGPTRAWGRTFAPARRTSAATGAWSGKTSRTPCSAPPSTAALPGVHGWGDEKTPIQRRYFAIRFRSAKIRRRRGSVVEWVGWNPGISHCIALPWSPCRSRPEVLGFQVISRRREMPGFQPTRPPTPPKHFCGIKTGGTIGMFAVPFSSPQTTALPRPSGSLGETNRGRNSSAGKSTFSSPRMQSPRPCLRSAVRVGKSDSAPGGPFHAQPEKTLQP